MSEITRRSPKMPPGSPVNDAINILEDMPRIPEGTPANSAAPGYAGAAKRDANYLYIHTGAEWKRAALSTF